MLNFRTLKLTLVFLVLAHSTAFAELWVKHDNGTIQGRHSGDCFVSGFCGKNNSNIDPSWVEVSQAEYDNARDPYFKVQGSSVVPMTQVERDAYDAAQAQGAADAQASKVAAFDDEVSLTQTGSAVLTKIDASIDNIQNLNDAKAWLKKLARYLLAQRGAP